MTRWVRWQDWAALVAGVYAFLSPLWTSTVHKGSVTLVILGIVTAVVALWSLAAPATVGPDGVVAVLGVIFFISPWLFGFHNVAGAAWTSWIVGVITFIVGATAIPLENKAHQQLSSHVAA